MQAPLSGDEVAAIVILAVIIALPIIWVVVHYVLAPLVEMVLDWLKDTFF
jgi:hypothetical protein